MARTRTRKITDAGGVVLSYYRDTDARLEETIASLNPSELVKGLIELTYLVSRIAVKSMPTITPLDLIEAVAESQQSPDIFRGVHTPNTTSIREM